MDWSLFHTLNGALRRRDSAQDAAQFYNAWAIFFVAVAGAIWFAATTPSTWPRAS